MNVTPAYYLCSIGFCNCRSSRILPHILGVVAIGQCLQVIVIIFVNVLSFTTLDRGAT